MTQDTTDWEHHACPEPDTDQCVEGHLWPPIGSKVTIMEDRLAREVGSETEYQIKAGEVGTVFGHWIDCHDVDVMFDGDHRG